MPPKKPKLTPEERKILRKEKRRQKKLRAAARKHQIKINKLEREIKYGNLTIKRHESSWKKLLVDIAVPEIRKELEYAWHNFERVIDAKDYTISLLMDEIKDAEEQYMLNFRAHCENIDKLVTLFRDQLDEMKVDYNNTVCELKETVDREIEAIKKSHKDGEDFLKMMLYGLEMTQKEQEQFIRCEYCSRLEEEAGRTEEIILKLQYVMNKDYARLWFITQDFMKEYYKSTAQRRKEYEYLNAQDEQVNELLRNQLNKIRKMMNMIKRLKQKLLDLHNTQGQNVHDLLLERKFFADSFWALKTQLEHEITTDNQNLTLLTSDSNKSMEYLKRIEKKGEQILQLAALCRKFETQKEKILPFPILGKITVSDADTEIDIDFYPDIVDLEQFWKRVGQANTLRYSIYEEKAFLMKENEKLKKKIHEYCECLDCYAIPAEEIRRGSVLNKIDGNEELKKYEKQGFDFDIPGEIKRKTE